MNRRLLWPLLAATFIFSATTHAGDGDKPEDRSSTYMTMHEKTRIAAEGLSRMTQGEVRKIDGNKVTIKLSSPAKVMIFEAANIALIESYKMGDKVHFTAVPQDGKLVLTTIQLS